VRERLPLKRPMTMGGETVRTGNIRQNLAECGYSNPSRTRECMGKVRGRKSEIRLLPYSRIRRRKREKLARKSGEDPFSTTGEQNRFFGGGEAAIRTSTGRLW